MKFKIGNLVQLKSGGPDMTIADILDNGLLKCIWFEGNKQFSEYLKPETLILINEVDGSIECMK